MLGLDRRVLHIAWTLFVLALGLVTIYAIRRTLVMFALAVFLATLLSPVVEKVHWMIPPSGSRGPAIAIVYVVLIGILVALAIPIGTTIADEAVGLAGRLPDAVKNDPLKRLPLPAWMEEYRDQVDQFARQRIQQVSQDVVPMLSAAGEQVLVGLGSALSFFLVPVLGFFALKDAVSIRRSLMRYIDPGSRDLVDGILTDLHLLLAHYMRALLFLAIATFISHTIVLSLMGVPYSLLLAGVAASLEIIPVIGPLSGILTIVLVALISGYPHMLWLIVFLICYRMFQDYGLSPFLMSEGVELHPLLVLLGVLAGEQIAGVPGMFFSVPVIAALRVILSRLRTHRHAVE